VSEGRLDYRQLRPMARPTHAGPCGNGPDDDALQLSKCARQDEKSSAYEQARKVSNPQPSVLETAAPPLARAQMLLRMTECAEELQTSVGPAGIPGLILEARVRADARRGCTPELRFGEVHAFHGRR
jgi:hypothetical protein